MTDILIGCESSMIAAFIAEGLISNREHSFIHVGTKEEAWMNITMANPAAIIFNEELNCSAWIKEFRDKGCRKIIHLEVPQAEWQAFAESFRDDPLTIVLSEPNLQTLSVMIEPLLRAARTIAS